ncbi:hypothetical protein [Halalkalibacter nanhaiisediminis]|uniref:Uncharacterized protein n=1 Tax=Halalkalibacter nanhaiisediminis TaxID=688079 RepID=A0A562QDI0_9BACI|nr:hypothetical protein [Halalkalibacter nanhaiisediminis]TWI54086.1 hypothetical protein IQ10_03189 [Halalkalibacter nanhaiisediminis]
MLMIFIYPLLVALYIVSRFIDIPFFSYSIGIIALIALFISFFHAKGLYLISGICFFAIGFLLFIQSELAWYELLFQFETMLGVLSLFLVLPFINSLIRVGHYDKNLSVLLERGVTNLNNLYKRSFLVSHLLGLFLNIATIPLLVKTLNNTLHQLPKKTADKFYTQNLLRAYALCLTWSPMEVMVSQSLDITGTSYFQIFPVIISIVLIAILSDWILSAFKFKEPLVLTTSHSTVSNKKIYKKIREMLLLLLILILSVSFTQYILDKGYLFSIIILIIPISIGWAFIIGKFKRYFKVTIPHWKERTRGLSNYFFMFLSAGLFVEMLSISGHLAFLQNAFIATSDNTLLFFLMIGAYFLITSFIGFHPLVSITLVAQLLGPIIADIPNVSLTIVLIACSLSTVMYSPYNLSVSILSEQIKINPYRLGLWNLPYAIFYMLLSISVAYLISLLS